LQLEETKETARAILQRAAAAGLLGQENITPGANGDSKGDNSRKPKKSKSRKNTGQSGTKKKPKKKSSISKPVAFGSTAEPTQTTALPT